MKSSNASFNTLYQYYLPDNPHGMKQDEKIYSTTDFNQIFLQ